MFSRILTRSIVRSSIVEHGIGVTRALSNMGGHMITKTDKERKETQRVRMTEKRDLRYKMQVDADIVAAVAVREDPLDLAPLRHHLATYADYWSSCFTWLHHGLWLGNQGVVNDLLCGGARSRILQPVKDCARINLAASIEAAAQADGHQGAATLARSSIG
jgi:hypothetical protein